jgi:hypothetical protein
MSWFQICIGAYIRFAGYTLPKLCAKIFGMLKKYVAAVLTVMINFFYICASSNVAGINHIMNSFMLQI